MTARNCAPALLAAVLAGLGTLVSAHETKTAGQIRLTIGWGDEPAFSGLKNTIDVQAVDAAGAPVVDPAARLSVEVAFDDKRIVLPLRPDGRTRGMYRAALIPTRPGTYSFHVTGTLKGQTVDVTSTCSDTTFECVTDPSELEFPAKDPSRGQLAASLSRAMPRAEGAASAAARARTLGIAAIGVAGLALVLAIVLFVGRGAKGI